MKKKKNVIGIGFHKTGTFTLDTALKKLGYKVLGAKTELASALLHSDIESVLKITEKYDAFQDNPWPLLYKELNRKFSNSKFIFAQAIRINGSSKW